MSNKKPKFMKGTPKLSVLQISEVLLSKNGNQYVIVRVEIEWMQRVQGHNIAFFLPHEGDAIR